MKRIFLSLLLLTGLVLAEESEALVFYVDSPEIVDMYFLVFSAIARVFSDGDYVSLLRLIFLVGGVMVFAGGIFKSFGGGGEGAIAGYLKYLIIGVAVLTLVFWRGNTDILIKSKYIANVCDGEAKETLGVAIPNGVPTLVAYGYYFTNQIGYALTELAVDTYSTVYDDPYAGMNKNNGYMGALKGAMRLVAIDPNKITLKTRVNDSNGTSGGTTQAFVPYDFGKAYKALFTDCILVPFSSKGDLGEMYLSELKATPDIVKFLEKLYLGNGVNVGGMNSKDFFFSYQGEIHNCGMFYQTTLHPYNERFKTDATCGLPVGYGAVGLITGMIDTPVSDFEQVAIQAGLVSQLEDSTTSLGVGVSGVSYASGKTRAEFIQSSLASGTYMAEMLPYLQMTIRAILYAFFPFVFVIVLLPGGLRVLGNYVQSLIWVELWSPTAAILDLFMTAHAKREIQDIYGGEGITMMSSIDMLSAGSTIAGVAGYLYLSVPALTWLILKGSAQMLQGITSATAVGMSKNITNTEINQDTALLEKTKEAGIRSGKEFSMAEMQHYEAIQSGRIEGAQLGVQMERGLESVTELSAYKTRKEIRGLEIAKDEMGMSGEKLADVEAVSDAVNTVTKAKTGNELKDINGNLNKDASKGTDKRATDEVQKTKADASQADDRKKHNVAYNEALKRMSKEKADAYMVEKYGYNDVTEWQKQQEVFAKAEMNAKTGNSVPGAKNIGGVSGANTARGIRVEEQRIQNLNEKGITISKEGQILADGVEITSGQQETLKELQKMSGHKGSLGEFVKEQGIYKTSVYTDDGKYVHETYMTKDGTISHTKKHAIGTVEYENNARRDAMKISENSKKEDIKERFLTEYNGKSVKEMEEAYNKYINSPEGKKEIKDSGDFVAKVIDYGMETKKMLSAAEMKTIAGAAYLASKGDNFNGKTAEEIEEEAKSVANTLINSEEKENKTTEE